jgi:hypothetical protein
MQFSLYQVFVQKAGSTTLIPSTLYRLGELDRVQCKCKEAITPSICFDDFFSTQHLELRQRTVTTAPLCDSARYE